VSGPHPDVLRARGRHNALSMRRGPDDPATIAARAELEAVTAVRAVDDPAQLAKAARIVRAALERKRLRLADLGVPDSEDAA
jgi:hypothetical protein